VVHKQQTADNLRREGATIRDTVHQACCRSVGPALRRPQQRTSSGTFKETCRTRCRSCTDSTDSASSRLNAHWRSVTSLLADDRKQAPGQGGNPTAGCGGSDELSPAGQPRGARPPRRDANKLAFESPTERWSPARRPSRARRLHIGRLTTAQKTSAILPEGVQFVRSPGPALGRATNFAKTRLAFIAGAVAGPPRPVRGRQRRKLCVASTGAIVREEKTASPKWPPLGFELSSDTGARTHMRSTNSRTGKRRGTTVSAVRQGSEGTTRLPGPPLPPKPLAPASPAKATAPPNASPPPATVSTDSRAGLPGHFEWFHRGGDDEGHHRPDAARGEPDVIRGRGGRFLVRQVGAG